MGKVYKGCKKIRTWANQMNTYTIEVQRISKEQVEVEAKSKERAKAKANSGQIEAVVKPDYGLIENKFIQFVEVEE